jgi:single-strand DNA-binding protein
MKSLNRAELIGNLGNTPEIRVTKKGQKVASLRVATNGYNHTEWHNAVAFSDGLVEIIEKYLTKGDRVYVAGELRTRSYESEGTTRYATELVVNDLVLLGSPVAASAEPA